MIYRCDDCGHDARDPPAKTCGKCGGATRQLWFHCNRCNHVSDGVGYCEACGSPESRIVLDVSCYE